MIRCRQDYLEYLAEDANALGIRAKNPIRRYFDTIYQFQKALRRHEYYRNCYTKPWQKGLVLFAAFRHRMLGQKLGFEIPINVFGKGLNIAHSGTIIVNGSSTVGDYCKIHACTNIGGDTGDPGENGTGVPQIGSRVYIAPGAKIIGGVTIADDIAVGANAVVNKSFTTPHITIAGIPARQISAKGSEGLLYRGDKK